MNGSHSALPSNAMRMLRLLTLAFTLLTLPAYGLAGLVQRSCQQEMSAPTHISAAGDCCPGKSDQGTTPCKRLGDPDSCTSCKAGYNCKSPQSWQPGPALVSLVLPPRSKPSVVPPTLLFSHSPDGLWRPPTLI